MAGRATKQEPEVRLRFDIILSGISKISKARIKEIEKALAKEVAKDLG